MVEVAPFSQGTCSNNWLVTQKSGLIQWWLICLSHFHTENNQTGPVRWVSPELQSTMKMAGLGLTAEQRPSTVKSTLKTDLQRKGRQGCLFSLKTHTGALRYANQSGTCSALSMRPEC